MAPANAALIEAYACFLEEQKDSEGAARALFDGARRCAGLDERLARLPAFPFTAFLRDFSMPDLSSSPSNLVTSPKVGSREVDRKLRKVSLRKLP